MKFVTTTLGRVLFALPFAVFGINHFMFAEAMKAYVPIPPQVIWVYITGIALILASLSILINKKAKLASLLLGIMLVIFATSVHLRALIGGDQMAMGQVLKDLSLAGAAFFYSGHAKD